MPVFNELLRRISQARRGVYVSGDAIDQVSNWDEPLAVRAWRAWAEANGAFERGDLRESSRWLNAVHEWSGDTLSAPLRGEVALLWARVLEAGDEPRRAMPYAQDAWATWFALASNPLLALDDNAIVHGVRALAHPDTLDVPVQQVFMHWMTDRASPNLHAAANKVFAMCRAVGDGTPAFALAEEWREWYRAKRATGAVPAGQIAVLEAHLLEDVANLHDQLGDPRSALEGFLEVRAILSSPGVDADPSRLWQLDFNIGNQQAKIGRHAEAIAAFERAATAFGEAGQEEAAIRARHAILLSRWHLGESEAVLLHALEDVLCEYERLIAAEDASAQAATQNLHQGNRLWLSLASRLLGEDVGHERFLHQVFAARQGSTQAHSVWRNAKATGGGAPTVIDEMSVLRARLDKEPPGLVILSLESGVDELLAVSLMGGRLPLSECLCVERLSSDCVDVLKALIEARRGATLDLASRAIAATSDPGAAFREACSSVWTNLPPETRRRLATADVVYFVPEPMGGLDEVPLELLHDGSTYLGLRAPVIRTASWTQMSRALAPNFVDHVSQGRLAVVRGPDVPTLGELWLADEEVAEVERTARETFNSVRALVEPSADEFLDLLKDGLDALHFTGHSYADEAGEYLVVGGEGRLGVPEIGTPRSQPAPAAILCSCLVGLHRSTRSGMARGIAGALLDVGAPGVVAAMVALPDRVGHDFALAVHFHAKRRPLSEAVMAARLTLSRRFHPAAWGCFAYFGRHDARLVAVEEKPLPAWPALLTRCLATRGTMWRQDLEAALARDESLTPELSANVLALLDAYVVGARGTTIAAVDAEHTLEADGRIALNAAADLVQVACDEDEAGAWKAASRALLMQRIADDTYLLVATVDAAVRRGLLHVQDESGATLVARASVVHGWLSRSGAGLRAAREALDELRTRWNDTPTFQVREMFGVDPDVFEAADAGDRSAQKELVWMMKAREASASALASNEPWTHWLYRFLGADSDGAMADFCGVVDAEARSGDLRPAQAELLRTLFKRYIGPGEIEAEHVDAALDAFTGREAEQEAIRLFRLYDRLTSQEHEVPAAEIAQGSAVAAAAGATGLAAFLALQIGARSLSAGDVAAARPIAESVLSDLLTLSATDPAYESRANLGAAFLYNVAQASGDARFQARVMRAHRSRIEAYMASQSARE